jgi:SAM-dependent methyltransferase
LELAAEVPAGPLVDVGCGVGRSTFELAQRFDDLVLGIDVNFSMLRLAADVLHTGTVRYPRRRVGLVYDRREFPAPFAKTDNVDFWVCDATSLPLPEGSFALASSLNVLDSVASPHDLLGCMARILKPGGKALIGCPYDWSAATTPLETWIGGHSQRGPYAGASEPLLRALLTPGGHPNSIAGLEIRHEVDGLTWRVRVHDRSTVEYRVHLVIAEAVQSGPTA